MNSYREKTDTMVSMRGPMHPRLRVRGENLLIGKFYRIFKHQNAPLFEMINVSISVK